MSAEDGTGSAVCILSLDSGGPGTYSQLLLIKEFISRLAADSGENEDDVFPADYFDLIGGTGFGGLAAIMLGHLRMNVEQAIDALLTIAYAVFPGDSQPVVDPEVNSKNLREAVEDMLHTTGVPLDTKMNDPRRPSTKCKVVIYAATSSNMGHPRAFRTYPSRGFGLNPTIVEAICATMSAPLLFSPTKIGPLLRQQLFVGSPVGANNPIRELLKEAGTLFGKDRRVSQIVSIGSGLARVLSLDSPEGTTNAEKLLRDMGADCETVAKEMSSRLFNVDAYLRLNVDRGMESCSMTDWRDMGAIESHTSAYVESTAVTKALEASLRRLRKRVGTVTLGQLNNTSGVRITAKRAPALSPYYVERPKESGLMVQHLVTNSISRQRVFPITGMGGCGKTQLVSYFLQEHPSLSAHEVFVDASSVSSIQSDLETWAQSLGDGHEHDSWEDGLRILSSLPEGKRSALILDNADDPTLNLVPFIPQNVNLTVIITSRNRHLGTLSTTYHLEVGRMGMEEGLSTLLHASRRQLPLPNEELDSARAIMKELGCLAVALVQVGTYCHELSSSIDGVLHPYTFTQYLTLFRSHRDQLMKKAGPSSLDNYERGAYATLDLSYGALPESAREFLHFISFFHHTNIPFSSLAAAASNSFNDPRSYLPRPMDHRVIISSLENLLCDNGKWSELRVHETIRTLRSFSLLSATSINDSLFLELHPLIQTWSRDMLPSSSQHYRVMVVQVLTACGSSANLGLYRHLLPHVLDMLAQQKGHSLHVNDLMSAGRLLYDQGYLMNAEALFETALENMKNAGQSEGGSVNITFWLASAYKRRGGLNEAERLEVEILEQQRKNLGREHPDTMDAAAYLAATYSYQGRWSEAEQLQIEVLERRRRTSGREHRKTIRAAADLAATYSLQGRWNEAELLETDVLEQSRRMYGREHPDTIQAAANMAATYRDQGRWSEAEQLQIEVLEQQRRIYGKESPDTICAAANLASIYRDQGRLSEAEQLEIDVLEQRRRIYGKEHPDTIRAVANLAATYRDQGRWSEAEQLETEVLEQQRRISGTEHPGTIGAAANLAATYRDQGRWSEAEQLQTEVLERRRKIYGPEHPHTISATANLAVTYHDQGRWSEAQQLQTKVLEQRRRIYGSEHPDTIGAAASLAATYRGQGQWSYAEQFETEVLEQRRRIYGRGHPDTIRAAANLAATYRDQGRWREAEQLEIEVLDQRRRIYRREHPDTIGAAANLAATYGLQGRWNEAEQLETDVLEQRRRTHGREHPDTIRAAANLAVTYRDKGRWSEAEQLETEVLEQQRRIYGMEHLGTVLATRSLAVTYVHQRRWGEAEALGAGVMERLRETLGAEHPHTIFATAYMAIAYRNQGRCGEAEQLEIQVLEQRTRIFGKEHPDTIFAAENLARTYDKQGRLEEAALLLTSAVELNVKVIGQHHPKAQKCIKDLELVYEKLGKEKEAQEMKNLLLT